MSEAQDRVVLFFMPEDPDDWTEIRDSIAVGHGAIPGVGETIEIGPDTWKVARREWVLPSASYPLPIRVRLRLAPK